MTPILILAAGQSSRMRGKDKLLENVKGQPLLRLMAQRALATGQPVFVALPGADHPRTEVLADLGVTLLVVPEAQEGLSGTLRGAVHQLPQASGFMMVLADLVAIGTDEMNAVLAARTAHPDHLIWRGATVSGKAGHPVIFDGSLRPRFAELSGDNGGEQIVKSLQQATYLVPLADDRARLDLDTPEDWQAWRARSEEP